MSAKLVSRAFLCAVFLCSFFCVAPILQSCSEGPEPFSDFTLHPDVPLAKFAAGRLGIVQPTFARSYLVVAYRYFSGVPLTRNEQLGAQAVWSDRIGNDNVVDPYADPDRAKNPYIEARSRNAREDWQQARKQVTTSTAPDIEALKDGPNYINYVNCSDDALENAVTTLNARVKAFGKENAGVKDWLAAQDAVFLNCGSPKDPPIPAPAAAALPEIFRFDREYQIAAAHMYAEHFGDAETAFDKIAGEEKSPWHEIAPYLVARNMVRRASLDVSVNANPRPNHGFNVDRLQAAETKIQTLLRDPRQKSLQASLDALLGRVEFRLHPEAQAVVISQRLRSPAPDGKFYQWLCDYTLLLNDRPDSRPGDFYDPRETDLKAFIAVTADRQKDELTDWIITFQAKNDSATAHALEVWRSHPTSVPWLLVLLAKIDSASPFSAEVLAAADKIPASSPAYVTAFYHRTRLRNAAKQFPEVRKSIDALFKSSAEIPNTSKNDLLDLRLDAANDLDDAVHFLARGGCPPEQDATNSACPQVLGPHSIEVMESMPLNTLVQAYQNTALSEEIKNQISRNLWMRGVLLNRHDVAQKLDAQLLSAVPSPQGIKPEYIADLMKQYEAATTPEEKQFAAVFFLQHQYAFGYEMGSMQPWCASTNGPWHDEPNYAAKQVVPVLAAFLTPDQKTQATTERGILDGADSQSNYYVKVVLEFAQKHPNDPRVPESLSRAVKNTDRNCNNSRTGALSKKAFVLLHSKYPNTSWAKNTKYWY